MTIRTSRRNNLSADVSKAERRNDQSSNSFGVRACSARGRAELRQPSRVESREQPADVHRKGASRSDDNGAVVEDTAPKDAESINV